MKRVFLTLAILLIDKTGSVRKAFGAARNETVALVYDKTGKLLYSFTGAPSAAAATTIWGKLGKQALPTIRLHA